MANMVMNSESMITTMHTFIIKWPEIARVCDICICNIILLLYTMIRQLIAELGASIGLNELIQGSKTSSTNPRFIY